MTALDLRTLTMEQTAALAGMPRVRHCTKPTPPVCDVCGGDCIWAIEHTAATEPYGTGYLIEVCEDCGRETGAREWWGH